MIKHFGKADCFYFVWFYIMHIFKLMVIGSGSEKERIPAIDIFCQIHLTGIIVGMHMCLCRDYENMDSGGECGVLAETMFYVPASNRSKFCDLSNNYLNGSIPRSFSYLPHLQKL